MTSALKRTRDESDSTEATLCDESMSLHLLTCQKSAKHVFSNNLKMPWDHSFVGPSDLFAKRLEMPLPVKELIKTANDAEPSLAEPMRECSTSAFKQAGLKVLRSCDERLWNERLSSERKAAVRKWTTLVAAEPSAWDIAVRHFSQGKMIFASDTLAGSSKGIEYVAESCKSLVQTYEFLQTVGNPGMACQGSSCLPLSQKPRRLRAYIP